MEGCRRLADAWPLFGLTIETPRLRLRLPRDDGLAGLSRVAADGVHEPHERPFLTPWTEGSAADRARVVLQGHWSALGTWDAQGWRLGLGIFVADQPIGVVTLRAQRFPVVREVTTSSWLGLPHHGQGLGRRLVRACWPSPSTTSGRSQRSASPSWGFEQSCVMFGL